MRLGKQGHRHHDVAHYTDGQPRRPVVSMDPAEAFTAHRAPVDLMQIAFEKLAAAACGTPFGYRANDRGPDADGQMRIAYGHSVGPGLKVIGQSTDHQGYVLGSRISQTGALLRRHATAHDVRLNDTFKFGEIVLEHLHKLAGGDIECFLVTPRLPRLSVPLSAAANRVRVTLMGILCPTPGCGCLARTFIFSLGADQPAYAISMMYYSVAVSHGLANGLSVEALANVWNRLGLWR